MSSINRTFNPKWVTYTGDGTGRDGYVVFTNGGLNETRSYKGSSKPSFDLGTRLMPSHMAAPRKDATPIDYIPDGTGRDTYIIKAFGLKRDYKSNCNDYINSLRGGEATPMMDKLAMNRRNPQSTDLSNYNNWISVKDRIKRAQIARDQSNSIERLNASPKLNTPMGQFLNGSATIDKHPARSRTIFALSKVQPKSAFKARNHSILVQPEKLQPTQPSSVTARKLSHQPVQFNFLNYRFANQTENNRTEGHKSTVDRQMVSECSPYKSNQFDGKVNLINGASQMLATTRTRRANQTELKRSKQSLALRPQVHSAIGHTRSKDLQESKIQSEQKGSKTSANFFNSTMVSSFGQNSSPLKVQLQNSLMSRPGHNRQLDDIIDTKVVNNKFGNATPTHTSKNLF